MTEKRRKNEQHRTEHLDQGGVGFGSCSPLDLQGSQFDLLEVFLKTFIFHTKKDMPDNVCDVPTLAAIKLK